MTAAAGSSHHRPPFLLLSSSSPARPLSSSLGHHNPSKSPFRYVYFPEKPPLGDPLAPPCAVEQHPLSTPARSPERLSPDPHHHHHRYHPYHHPAPRPPPPHPPRILLRPPLPPPLPSQSRGRPQGFRIPDRLKPWLGIGSWVVTSLAFLLAIAFWKKEVFTGLDNLSVYLQSLGHQGYVILFCLIFITTIPPLPLYSTLIILSGYTFGAWHGAAISYAASLSGAVIVFLLSRHYLRECMHRLLSHTLSLKRVVRAIEKRPSLLLLIRIAPYPYNLMNVLLASSHRLSFQTYFTCTALSLFKVIVHTTVGAGIHSFAGYHHAVMPEREEEDGTGGNGSTIIGGGGKKSSGEPENGGLARAWTVAGIILCFAIFVYLSYVARRAVDDELLEEDEEGEGAVIPQYRRPGAGRDQWQMQEEAVGLLSPPSPPPPPPPQRGEWRTAVIGGAEEMRQVQQSVES